MKPGIFLLLVAIGIAVAWHTLFPSTPPKSVVTTSVTIDGCEYLRFPTTIGADKWQWVHKGNCTNHNNL